MRDAAWHKNLDWVTLFLWAILALIGLAAIYSATSGPASQYLLDSVQQNFDRQLMWFGICIVGIAVALMLPLRFYQHSAYVFYAVTVLLCIVTIFFGREINGAVRWLTIGGVNIQASEFAKFATVLAVSHYLSSRRGQVNSVMHVMFAIGLVLLPSIVIVFQNDTGTALIFLALIPIVLFWSGLPQYIVLMLVSPVVAGYLAIVYLPAAIGFAIVFALGMLYYTRDTRLGIVSGILNAGAAAVVVTALSKILLPHQVARIASFVDPEAYRLTSGFHVIQAKAAIGSGGFWGKGYMEGTQTQMAFVPEQSTDFIFCVIGEEAGFAGSIFVLGVFAFLLIRLLMLGDRAKHPFPRLFAACTVGIFLFHIIVNVGMVTGTMPVMGIPLPFVSYGGSALVANTAMLATIVALYMRRNELSIYAY